MRFLLAALALSGCCASAAQPSEDDLMNLVEQYKARAESAEQAAYDCRKNCPP